MPPREPYIPQTISELIDMLGMMMLNSPQFIDKSGYFPDRNIDTVFHEFTASLQLLREKLGEPLYLKLIDMTGHMRAHFDSDPEDKTGDARKGRAIISQMEPLLIQAARKSRNASRSGG